MPPLKAEQSLEMVFESIVTAACKAIARPHNIFAVVLRVILWSAKILPANVVLVPRVAELPTYQNTPGFTPPLIIDTEEPLAVVNVE